jgi:hypothetical protein
VAVIIKVPEGQTAEVLEGQAEEVPEGQAAKVEVGEQAPKVEVPEQQEEEWVETEMHNSMFALSFYYVIFVEVF